MSKKYALNLADDGRVLSATFDKFSHAGTVIVDELPEGNLSDYIWQDNAFVYDPLPEPEPVTEEPSQLDRVEAQVTYTAMMTDTLLESEA